MVDNKVNHIANEMASERANHGANAMASGMVIHRRGLRGKNC